ncbi:hypothetical protein GWG65_25210 [Bradyrhizobium sp. CSA207]|nr:hypothetical protein [Bradyrhizobium sp. CSA207]
MAGLRGPPHRALPSPHKTVAIDQYAEAATGNREYFLNKAYSIGGN